MLARIYLDACCLNRLSDDQSQDRVREEANAVRRILQLVRNRRVVWVASTALEAELSRNPDFDKMYLSLGLLVHAAEVVAPGPLDFARAQALQALGFGAFDALHLACAERAGAGAFLTTDDRLIRTARRHVRRVSVPVMNPISWNRVVQ